MAFSKKEEFSRKDQRLASLAKGLSHPARVAILRVLADRQSCVCGEIVAVLPLAQSTVSQHLKELKELGLIQGDVEGTRSCYCIDWKAFREMETMLKEFLGNVRNKGAENGCC